MFHIIMDLSSLLLANCLPSGSKEIPVMGFLWPLRLSFNTRFSVVRSDSDIVLLKSMSEKLK